MTGAELILGVTGAVLAAGALERARHERLLRRIPVRVHVNGTRGKSSVTRLIAAAARAAGRRTCAKTTGTLARMILPDGHEVPVFRPSRPNVIEQLRIVRTAAELDAEILVVECMAVQPELQWVSESKFIRATHGVITNARADHLDQMGPTENDVALALCGMVPRGGRLFTAERRHLATLAAAAADRSSSLCAVGDADVAAVSQSELAGFRYKEHPDNVALALAVTSDLGIPRDVALAGMQAAAPDPGALTEHSIDFHGRHVVFVNGFAANDPESTQQIWRMACERHPSVGRRIAVFNCRSDRAERSVQLGEVYPSWPQADAVVLIGTGTFFFARAAVARGLDPARIVYAEEMDVSRVFETLMSKVGRSAMVMGMGNIGGPGLELVAYFKNRELPAEG